MALVWFSPQVLAAKVTLVGLFPGKAVIVIDDGPPRTVSVGQKTAEGILLVSSESGHAQFEIDGKRTTLEIGEHFAPPKAETEAPTAILLADAQGRFVSMGKVNNRSVRFLVDTGATTVSLPASIATTLGLDYRKGTPVTINTANGNAPAFKITLNTVSIGDITLNQVEAVVYQGAGMDVALLGMSFLNRVNMKREGPRMVLTRRF